MKINITYSNKATIPTGKQYENQSPFYSMTREIEIPDSTSSIETHVGFIESENLKEMKQFIDGLIVQDFITMRDFLTREEPPEEHYHLIDGKKIPRVTAIISPDKPNIPFLEDHGKLGTHLDMVMKNYIDTGKLEFLPFQDSGNIKTTWAELFKVTQEWVEKYPIKFIDHSKKVFDEELLYCGELDAIAEVEDGFVLCDFKKTEKLTKDTIERFFIQMSAYAKAYDTVKIEKMIICSPFNPPVIETDIEGYFNKFKKKREEYRKRFGI